MEHHSRKVLKKSSSGRGAPSALSKKRFEERRDSTGSPRKKRQEYTIRRADPDSPEDQAAIERLWLDNLPGISGDGVGERFDWLYRRNPAGPALTWLAIDCREGMAVGCASINPREVVIEGNSHRGGFAMDFSIDTKHRSYGLALRMQRAISSQVWEEGIEFLFCFPNAASRGIFQRIGYRSVGRSWRGAMLLKTASKLILRGYPARVARVLGFGIDLVYGARNILALYSGLQTVPGRYAVLDAPDERWDIFWERLSPGLQFAGSRDLGNLRWRYQLRPGWQGRYFCMLDEADGLLGYLVFSSHGDLLVIDDVAVLEERLLKPLLARFRREMRSSGAAVINVCLVGSDAAIEAMIAAGLLARDSEGWAGVLVSPEMEQDLCGILQASGAKWYLMDDEVDW